MFGLTVCPDCNVLAVQWMGPLGLCGYCDTEWVRDLDCGCFFDNEGDLVPCGDHVG